MDEQYEAVEVHVRIRTGAGPVEGSIEIGADGARPFGGWMDLMAALEAARAGTVDSGKRDTSGG